MNETITVNKSKKQTFPTPENWKKVGELLHGTQDFLLDELNATPLFSAGETMEKDTNKPKVKKPRSQESRDRMSAIMKGRKQSEETASKRSASLKGYKHSEEHNQNIANGMKGKHLGSSHGSTKLTEEAVLKMREHFASGNVTIPALAEYYEISYSTAYNIVHRKYWTHI